MNGGKNDDGIRYRRLANINLANKKENWQKRLPDNEVRTQSDE